MDVLKLQAQVDRLVGQRDRRVERQQRHRQEWDKTRPVIDKWDFLKDYPGQSLSEQEFRARLGAHNEARWLARQVAHYGALSENPGSKSSRNEWRRKPKRRA